MRLLRHPNEDHDVMKFHFSIMKTKMHGIAKSRYPRFHKVHSPRLATGILVDHISHRTAHPPHSFIRRFIEYRTNELLSVGKTFSILLKNASIFRDVFFEYVSIVCCIPVCPIKFFFSKRTNEDAHSK